MVLRFTARSAGVDEDDGECLTAGVAEHEDGSGLVLMFMCDLYEPDEQEVGLGFDTHCLVTADQGTAYGAVEEIVLRGKVLRVRVAADCLEALGLDDQEVEASLEVDDDTVHRLREGLRRIMAHGRADARPQVVDLGYGRTSTV